MNIPLLDALRRHGAADYRRDVIAGITVSVVLIPQAMAYALLAGMPPVYGLYASIIPLLVYALLGSSPHLSVGPTALIALLVLTGVGEYAEPNSAEFIAIAIAVSLLAGVLQLLLGVLRLGILVSFLSRPVISGFTTAAAIIIIGSQLKYLLGIATPSGNTNVFVNVAYVLSHLGQAHLPTVGLSLFALLLLVVLRRWPSLPNALLAIMAGTAVTWVWLAQLGVAVVGDIPQGLPQFSLPLPAPESFVHLLTAAITIALISFIESLAISKTIESRHQFYRVSANQELIALGAAKIIGSFFQAFPTTGSFSRSAVLEQSGGRSGLASIVTALIVVLVLLFLTPLFYFLPQAVLAAVIIMAVKGLIEWREIVYLWRHDRRDFLNLATTLVFTLVLGIQQGVLLGVAISIFLVIYRNARPHIAVLGRLPSSNHFRNITRFNDTIQQSDILIVRFDAQLYFANAEYFRDSMLRLVRDKGEELRLLILDAGSIYDLDSTGVYMLQDLLVELRRRNIEFYMVGVIGPVRDVLYRTGMVHIIGTENQFLEIQDAIAYYQDRESGRWSERAIQTNIEE